MVYFSCIIFTFLWDVLSRDGFGLRLWKWPDSIRNNIPAYHIKEMSLPAKWFVLERNPQCLWFEGISQMWAQITWFVSEVCLSHKKQTTFFNRVCSVPSDRLSYGAGHRVHDPGESRLIPWENKGCLPHLLKIWYWFWLWSSGIMREHSLKWQWKGWYGKHGFQTLKCEFIADFIMM